MKYRIVKITREDGSKKYRCERTGLFTNQWRTILIPYDEFDDYAIFDTLEEAKRFLHIHPSQKVKSEKVIMEL